MTNEHEREPSAGEEPREDQNQAESPQGGWTWERPEDGSPVYGADEGARAMDAIDPKDIPDDTSSPEGQPQMGQPQYGPAGPEPYDIPPVSGPPVVGPAKTPEQRRDEEYRQAPPQPPYQQQGEVPQPPPNAPEGYSPWGPVPDYPYYQQPYNYGGGWQQQGGYPASAPPPQQYTPPQYAPPSGQKASDAKTYGTLALICVCGGLLCQPLGIIGGIIGLILSMMAKKAAEQNNESTHYEKVLVWMSLFAIIGSALLITLNIIVLFFMGDTLSQFGL